MVMSAPQSDHALVVVVPQSDLSRSAMLLHREFFAQPDPGVFAACRAEVAERKDDAQAMAARSMPHPPQKLRLVLQLGR
jgi:hypothetical protein